MLVVVSVWAYECEGGEGWREEDGGTVKRTDESYLCDADCSVGTLPVSVCVADRLRPGLYEAEVTLPDPSLNGLPYAPSLLVPRVSNSLLPRVPSSFKAFGSTMYSFSFPSLPSLPGTLSKLCPLVKDAVVCPCCCVNLSPLLPLCESK